MSKRAEATKAALRDRFIEEINRLWPQAMGRVCRAENKLTGAEEQAVLQQMASYAEAYFYGALAAVRENLQTELELERIAKAAKAARKAKRAKNKAYALKMDKLAEMEGSK